MSRGPRNILLVMPPLAPSAAIGKNLAAYKEIPYGLLSIASWLHHRSRRRVRVEILDLGVAEDHRFEERIGRRIEELRPEIVGVSGLFNSMYGYVNDFARSIKASFPEVVLVVGGNIATNCYRFLLERTPCIDGVCKAEGELPMLALAEADDPRAALREHAAWITADKLRAGAQPAPAFVHDLDELPPIDFSLIDLARYDTRCRNNDPIAHAEARPLRLPFVTSRGCPFDCVFCAAASLSGKRVRFMSAERVIEDIRLARDRYGMTRLVINDDQALIDRKRFKKILGGIADLGLVLELPSGLNARFIDEEMAAGLRGAGLDVANLAVESGSDRVLRNIIRKPLKVRDVRPAVDTLREHGLLVHGFFVFGFPEERDEDRAMTVDLIKAVGFDWANVYAAAPLRGSRLHDICVEKGYLRDDDSALAANIYESSIRTSEVDPEAITRYVYRVNLEVNFVANYRMRIGDHATARSYFANVVREHPGHAFAHYYLARCLERLGGEDAAARHQAAFAELVRGDERWAGFARDFQLA